MWIAVAIGVVILLVVIAWAATRKRGSAPTEESVATEARDQFRRWAGLHGYGQAEDVEVPTGEAPDGLEGRVDRVLTSQIATRADGDRIAAVVYVDETGSAPSHHTLVSIEVAGLQRGERYSDPTGRGRGEWAQALAERLGLDEAATRTLTQAATEVAGTTALHAGESRLDAVLHGPTGPLETSGERRPYTAELTKVLDSTHALASVLAPRSSAAHAAGRPEH